MKSNKGLHHYWLVFERQIVDMILTSPKIAYWISKHCLKLYLRLFYFHYTRVKHLHYRHPADLNQALMKLSYQNSKNPIMKKLIPLCVDKYAVREFIAAHGYGDTLNEIIGVYDNVDDIDFNVLPNKFVMKMTNASGRNWICDDKSKYNWEKSKKQFAIWIQDHDFGWDSGEWQYAYIQPRILIEKYLENLDERSIIDYKFNCYHGKVRSCFVAYNRNPEDAHSREVCFDDYDVAWNRTEAIKESWHTQRKFIPKPQNYDRMLKMAEECTKDFPYCRFDLYEIEGKIVFGEMTFTPQGNVLEFYKDEWLKEMLKYLQ